jgi:hypothetical protein
VSPPTPPEHRDSQVTAHEAREPVRREGDREQPAADGHGRALDGGALELALVDAGANGRAPWTSENAGARRLRLPPAKQARKPGRYALKATVSGRTKTVPVTVNA